MKTVGLIGGLSWKSTAEYYRLLNERVHDALGGQHSARIVLWSVDFADVEALQEAGDWQAAGSLLGEVASHLETAGADVVLICANTMHETSVELAVRAAVGVPVLSIMDAVAAEILARGCRTVGLLGTAYTMERPFYRERLEAHGLTVLVPDEAERGSLQRIIYDELLQGIVRDESRREFQAIVGRLADRGAQGVVLGCTEFPMLVRPDDLPVASFDSTEIHARAAAEFALGRTLLPAEPAPGR